MLIVLFGFSCLAPANKEAYLKKFENFVNRIEKNSGDYNDQDWKWADNQFEKYRSTWYDEFRDDLTAEEKLNVAGLVLKYQSLKGKGKLKGVYKKYIREDLEKTKKNVREYMDKNLDKDVDELIKGAKEIGDSALKAIEDITNDLKKKN